LYAQKSAKDNFEKKSLVGKQKDESYVVPTSQIIYPAGTIFSFTFSSFIVWVIRGKRILVAAFTV
jgi:hypothetical protein